MAGTKAGTEAGHRKRLIGGIVGAVTFAAIFFAAIWSLVPPDGFALVLGLAAIAVGGILGHPLGAWCASGRASQPGESMTPTRPNYGRYLLWWGAAWLLLTVPTQLPECYERSVVNVPKDRMSIFGELIKFANGRLLIEVPLGVIWASLSWLLQWGMSVWLGRLPAPGYLRTERTKRLWASMAAVVLLAAVEVVVLGLPLAYLNTDFANFSLAIDDTPAVTITDRSIMIESLGILLAFPLACLVAGYFGGCRRKPPVIHAAVEHNDAWPPAPRSPL